MTFKVDAEAEKTEKRTKMVGHLEKVFSPIILNIECSPTFYKTYPILFVTCSIEPKPSRLRSVN